MKFVAAATTVKRIPFSNMIHALEPVVGNGSTTVLNQRQQRPSIPRSASHLLASVPSVGIRISLQNTA
jgi:hypothetical protein